MKLLVVEDHEKMAQSLQSSLGEIGYAVDIAGTGLIASELIKKNKYDLIILDVMLPDQTGLDIARQARTHGFNGPILMLTALSTTKDKVQGLDAGADDYLTKPYSFEELQARIRALLRRHSPKGASSQLQYSDLELDLIDRKAKRRGQDITLTTKEFALLEYLMTNPEQPLSRAKLAAEVWDIHFDSESNVIDVYINMVRKKIDSPFDKKLIQTVVGIGYMLKSEA